MSSEFEAFESLSEEILRRHLSIIPDINSPHGPFRESLLHKAVQKQWKNGVLILLENNIDIELGNSYGQNALHYAVASKSTDIVRLFIERGSEKFINSADKRGHTVLHDAAALGLREIVEDLIEAGAVVDVADRNGLTPLHKAVFARDPKIVYHLLSSGANIQAVDNMNRNILSFLLSSYQDLFTSVLNLSFSENDDKYCDETRINVHFYPLCNNANHSDRLNVIRDIIKFGSLKLASHPLCEAFLLLQWLSLRKYFMIDVFFYFLFTILSTVLIFNKFIWIRYKEFSCIPPEGVTYTLCFVLVAIGAIAMLLRQFFILVHGIRIRYFSAWYIFNFIVPVFVLIVIPGEYSPWQDHLAVITLCFSWSQGMLHIGRFPKWGIYITMFTSVAKNFLRMFLIFFCVFIAFALSFNMIYFANHFAPNGTEYDTTYNFTLTKNEVQLSNFWIMLLKTLVMMVGELNFDSNVIEILGYLPGTSYCVYAAFIFLISIILSNLLVALAVSDVQTLKNQAHVEKLFKQAEVAELIETTCDVISRIFRVLSFSRLSKKIAFSSIFSDNSKIYVALNDHLKGGCLVLKENKDVKVISMTSHFVDNVKQCLRSNRFGYGDQMDKPEPVESSLKKLRLQIASLSKKMDDMLSSISDIEKKLNNFK